MYRINKCDTCPRLVKYEDLKRNVEQSRLKWLSEDQQLDAPTFQETMDALYVTRALAGSPVDQISVTSSILASVFRDEEDRHKRSQE